MFVDIAYAMGSSGEGGGGGGGILDFLLPFIIIIAVFYFLIIMPQRRQAKKRREMLQSMNKGDTIITRGGIRGKIVGFKDNDQVVVIQVGEGVKLEVVRSFVEVVGRLPEETGREMKTGMETKKKGGFFSRFR
jgi:preprotein translocase subunit YajC